MSIFKKRQKLTFNEATKTFKILMLCDYQETFATCEKAILSTKLLLKDLEAKGDRPDLIILGGDNTDGPGTKNKKDLKLYLQTLTSVFNDEKIPFCHLFGNHDYDVPIPIKQEMKLYQRMRGCLSQTTPDIHGYTNYMLPVYSSESRDLVFAIWCMDTGNRVEIMEPGLTDAARPKGILKEVGPWDTIRFDQQMWYWKESVRLEKKYRKKIPGLMAMHIAPWEFMYMRRTELPISGSAVEDYNLGTFNSGLFFTLLQRGDIKCIAAGHTHRNNCTGNYCGITMANCSTAGFSSYGDDDTRGGRLFIIHEEAPEKIQSRMIFYKDIFTDSEETPAAETIGNETEETSLSSVPEEDPTQESPAITDTSSPVLPEEETPAEPSAVIEEPQDMAETLPDTSTEPTIETESGNENSEEHEETEDSEF